MSASPCRKKISIIKVIIHRKQKKGKLCSKKSSHGGVSYRLVPPDVEAGGVSHQLDEFGILGVVKVAVRDPELRNCRGIQFLPSFCFGIKDQGRVQSDVLPSVGYPNLEHDFLTVLIVTNLSCFNWFSVSDLKSNSILN